MTTDNKSGKIYSPWMNNWEQNFKNPKKETKSILQNSFVKGVLWVAFFAFLISPVLALVLGPMLSSKNRSTSISTGANANDIKRLIGETEKSVMLNNYDKAIQRANFLITENSDIPKIYVLAGLAYFYQRNYQEAIEFANEALKVNPRYVSAEYLIGMCAYKNGIGVDESLISNGISSEYEYSYILRALFCDETNNYEEMLTTAQNGCQVNSKSLMMYYLLALAQYRNAEFTDSMETIEKLSSFRIEGQISSSAIIFRSMILKAEILLTLGSYDEAFEILQENYTAYRDSWELNRVFSEYYNSTTMYPNLIQLLEKYGDPSSKRGMNFDVLKMYTYRAFAYFKTLKLNEAYRDYKKIIGVETGLNEDELKDLDLVMDYLTPDCHKALLKIAHIEQLKGNKDTGRIYLKHVDSSFLSDEEMSEFNDLKSKLNQ